MILSRTSMHFLCFFGTKQRRQTAWQEFSRIQGISICMRYKIEKSWYPTGKLGLVWGGVLQEYRV